MNSALTVIDRRLIEASAEILGGEAKDISFLHSILSQCSLPYREPEGEKGVYIKQNGKASIIIQAGYLVNPKTGVPELQGVPYGAKPRLLLIHLCTEAIRLQKPNIEVQDSMSAFMKKLGLSVTGGKKGSIGRFKEQLNRLAACRMQIAMASDRGVSIVNPSPVVKRFDLWFPSDPRQKILWPSEIVLSDEFFSSLKNHAMPLDYRAIKAIQHNARALDLYVWLAHRLPRVKGEKGDRISWQALHSQFGSDISELNNFRRKTLEALKQTLAIYPKARVKQVEGGLLLSKSAPPIKGKVSKRRQKISLKK